MFKLKSNLVWGFRKRAWSRIYSIDVGVGKSLLVKCSQAFSSWIKKSSLLYFCNFLCTICWRIWFCLKRAKPWLEFKIKFNRYSMRSFHRVLVGWSSLWIHLSLREFNWVSISRMPYPPFQMGIGLDVYEDGFSFLLIESHRSFFQFLF